MAMRSWQAAGSRCSRRPASQASPADADHLGMATSPAALAVVVMNFRRVHLFFCIIVSFRPQWRLTLANIRQGMLFGVRSANAEIRVFRLLVERRQEQQCKVCYFKAYTDKDWPCRFLSEEGSEHGQNNVSCATCLGLSTLASSSLTWH